MVKSTKQPDVPPEFKDAVLEGQATEEEIKMEIAEQKKPTQVKIGMIDNEDIQSQYLLQRLKFHNKDKQVTIISKEGGNTAIIKECEDKEITDLYVPITNTDWLKNSIANSIDKLKKNDFGIKVHTPLQVHETTEVERLANEKGIEPTE